MQDSSSLRDGTVDATPSTQPSHDLDLMEVLEQAGRQIDQGLPVDVDALAEMFPDRADYLRELIETLRRVQALGATTDDLGNWPSGKKQIGEFRLVRRIASGGMGTVFEAEQGSLDRRVAVKVLHFAGMTDDRRLARFKNEARAAAALHHPHIVPVFSVGQHEDVHYFAMQFIDGCSLADVIDCALDSSVLDSKDAGSNGSGDHRSMIARRTADQRENDKEAYLRTAVRWIIASAEALSFAHHSGVLHRDIKPGNLMVDLQEKVWVSDFGLARLSVDDTITASGELVGTVRYMSPEQAFVRKMPIDHRTDIYSLGVTLYELLTLRPAIVGTDQQEILTNLSSGKVVAPSELESTIGHELETIIQKAIAFDAEDRYQTADELADDLRRFLANKPVLAKRPTAIDRASKWIRKHQKTTLSVAATTLVFSLLLSGAAFFSFAAWKREKAATRAALLSQEFAKRLLYLSDVKLASTAIVEHDLVRARRLLSRHIPASNGVDHRGFVWRHLWQRANPERLVFREHRGAVNAATHYLGGHPGVTDQIASVDEEGSVLLWDCKTGKVAKAIDPGLGSVNSIVAAKDGRVFYLGLADGTLISLESDTEKVTSLGKVSDAGIRTLDLSDDESRLVTGSEDGKGGIFDLKTGKTLFRWSNRHKGRCDAYFLPDGSVASIDDDWHVAVRRMNEVKRVECFRPVAPFDKLGALAISEDATQIAYGTKRGSIGLIDMKTEQTIWQFELSQHRIECIRFFPDRPWMVAGDKDGTVTLVDYSSGTVLTRFGGHSDRVTDLEVSPGGKYVVSTSDDRHCRVFDLEILDAEEPLASGDAKHNAALSDDASHLLVMDCAGPVRMRNGNKWIATRGSHLHAVRAAYSADASIAGTFYSPVLLSNSSFQNADAVERIDVDDDGDADWVSGIGGHLVLVWQENLGDDRRGAIRTVSEDFSDRLYQWIPHSPNDTTGRSGQLIWLLGLRQRFISLDSDSLQRREWHVEPGSISDELEAVWIDDLDEDGNFEFMLRDVSSGKLQIYSERDGKTREAAIKVDKRVSVCVMDVNSDGMRDIVLADYHSGDILWLRQTTEGEFSPPLTLIQNLGRPLFVAARDFNSDGRMDLVTTDAGTVVGIESSGQMRFSDPVQLNHQLEVLCDQMPPPDIAVWDTETAQLLCSLRTMDGITLRVAISPDNQFLAATGKQRRLRIFHLPTSKCVQRVELPDFRIESLAYSPEGDRLAVGYGDACILLDTKTWSRGDLRLEHRNTVNQIRWLGSGEHLITAGHDLRVRIWNTLTGRMVRELSPFDSRIRAVALSPDQSTLAVGSLLGTLSLWDIETGQPLMEQENSGGEVLSIGFGKQQLDFVLKKKDGSLIRRRVGALFEGD